MPPELVELVMGYADWEGIMALRKVRRPYDQPGKVSKHDRISRRAASSIKYLSTEPSGSTLSCRT